MKNKRRFIARALLPLILSQFLFSCASSHNDEKSTKSSSEIVSETKTYSFNGETFAIYALDTEKYTFSSSYAMIADDGPATDVVANDVYLRNKTAENELNIDLSVIPFTVLKNTEGAEELISSELRKLDRSGDTTYSLYINNLYYLANLSLEGMFSDIGRLSELELEAPYWFSDYMNDAAMLPNQKYILAGDYFIDILRSAHCMIFNKSLFANTFTDESADALYDLVREKKWTLDKCNEYISGAYLDLDANDKKSSGDQFGFVSSGSWPSVIPFVLSCDVKLIERDENGIPLLADSYDRAATIADKVTAIYQNSASNYRLKDRAVEVFSEGRSLFLGDARLASLEYLRTLDIELGVIPYPTLNEGESYVTATHDVTEVGSVPRAVSNTLLVGATLEYLCRVTSENLLPDYYENGLKLKYAHDTTTAEMIDIIHGNLKDSFIPSYEHALGSTLLYETFNIAIRDKQSYTTLYRKNHGIIEAALKDSINALKTASTFDN